ncbi:hypothetical protein [Botrytis cinerea RNA virus 2]|nr:hypothetical protein [Botrytis cinerea RNA virus 2]
MVTGGDVGAARRVSRWMERVAEGPVVISFLALMLVLVVLMVYIAAIVLGKAMQTVAFALGQFIYLTRQKNNGLSGHYDQNDTSKYM